MVKSASCLPSTQAVNIPNSSAHQEQTSPEAFPRAIVGRMPFLRVCALNTAPVQCQGQGKSFALLQIFLRLTKSTTKIQLRTDSPNLRGAGKLSQALYMPLFNSASQHSTRKVLLLPFAQMKKQKRRKGVNGCKVAGVVCPLPRVPRNTPFLTAVSTPRGCGNEPERLLAHDT